MNIEHEADNNLATPATPPTRDANARDQSPTERTPGERLTPAERRDLQALAKATIRTREDRQSRFLEWYGKTGRIVESGTAAGVDRATHYKWLNEDPTYPERFAQAHGAYVDKLEREAERRALEGVDKPVGFYQGMHGGTFERVYSDQLLQTLLKANAPDKYRETLDVRSASINVDLTKCTDEQLTRLSSGEHPLSVFGSAENAAAYITIGKAKLLKANEIAQPSSDDDAPA